MHSGSCNLIVFFVDYLFVRNLCIKVCYILTLFLLVIISLCFTVFENSISKNVSRDFKGVVGARFELYISQLPRGLGVNSV